MHTPHKSPSSRHGFTLVELLTVIAIIAVLMGILFPTIGSAIESAKKTQAKNDAIQIVNAIKGYYTEYGKYPSINASSGDVKISSESDNVMLMNILRGKDDVNNPRKIVFLEVPDAKNFGDAKKERAGLGKSGQYLDPWGGTAGFYNIFYDGDYDNQLDNPYSNAGNSKLSTGAIAWSLGRDGKGGSGDKLSGNAKDDVLSFF